MGTSRGRRQGTAPDATIMHRRPALGPAALRRASREPKQARRFQAREQRWPLALALASFAVPMAFLLAYGEMFYWGSDLVANAAYGVTLFSDVIKSGWTVPKPAELLIYGILLRLTGDLWFLHLALIIMTAVTVWAGCRLILDRYGSRLACVAFAALVLGLPRIFGATLSGGSGVMSVMFLMLAIRELSRMQGDSASRLQPRATALAILFLSMANLSRPDCWPCTYLIVAVFFWNRMRAKSGWSRSDAWFLAPLAMPLVWIALGAAFFGDPLYSMNIARSFAVDHFSDEATQPMAGAGPLIAFANHLWTRLPDLYFENFRSLVHSLLFSAFMIAGAFVAARRDKRSLMLLLCPIAGTLLFYLVYAFRGILFRTDYLYAVLFFSLIPLAIGFATAMRFLVRVPFLIARRPAPARMKDRLPAVLLPIVLLALLAGPFRTQVIRETLPTLRERAKVARTFRPAVDQLVRDIRAQRASVPPVIIGSQWLPPSRIALKLGTGKDLYLLERVGRKANEQELPDLTGRILYCALHDPPPKGMEDFLHGLVGDTARRDMIYRRDGIAIVRSMPSNARMQSYSTREAARKHVTACSNYGRRGRKASAGTARG